MLAEHDEVIEVLQVVEQNCLRALQISEQERRGVTSPIFAARALLGLLVQIARKLSEQERLLIGESLRTVADMLDKR